MKKPNRKDQSQLDPCEEPRSEAEKNTWPYVYAGKARYYYLTNKNKFICEVGDNPGKYFTRDEKGSFHETNR